MRITLKHRDIAGTIERDEVSFPAYAAKGWIKVNNPADQPPAAAESGATEPEDEMSPDEAPARKTTKKS